jgi:hypothetical protein
MAPFTSVVSTMTHQRGLRCSLWNKLGCGAVFAITKRVIAPWHRSRRANEWCLQRA